MRLEERGSSLPPLKYHTAVAVPNGFSVGPCPNSVGTIGSNPRDASANVANSPLAFVFSDFAKTALFFAGLVSNALSG